MTEACIETTITVPIRLKTGREVTTRMCSFSNLSNPGEHFAVRIGDHENDEPLVRLHSECATGDVFGSLRCDCGEQLSEALSRLSDEGGILLYLRQEGRGIGLYQKFQAYALQDLGYDTFAANQRLGLPADTRSYIVAAEMLRAMGIKRIKLLSNNPDKRRQLEETGITVSESRRTGVFWCSSNDRYLRAKAEFANHTISLP